MKRKFEVCHDIGFENENGPSKEIIKTFKNEPEAINFYTNPKNTRRYGTLYLKMTDENGDTYEFDDRREMWQQK